MGARLLRQWMLRPLLDREAHPPPPGGGGGPRRRLRRPGQALRQRLGGVGDLERLTSRAALGVAHARDLVALRGFLGRLPGLAEELGASAPRSWRPSREEITPLPDLQKLLEEALEDEPPLVLREGGLIREGWNDGAARAQARRARRARSGSPRSSSASGARTGIPSLKVRFNRVFGYAIEVSNAHGARVPARLPAPPDPGRRGALRHRRAQGVREPRARRRGAHRPARVRALRPGARPGRGRRPPRCCAPRGRWARSTRWSRSPTVAHERGHVRPEVDDGLALEIVDGRHPVLEAAGCAVHAQRRCASIPRRLPDHDPHRAQHERQERVHAPGRAAHAHGPDGRLRARALAPRVGLVDRILTRVGAQDNMARGAEHVPGGDGGDREHPPPRHRAQPHPPG